MTDIETRIRDYYADFGGREAILAALAKRGIPLQGLTPDQLAPFDQFHTGGAIATRRLADVLAPRTTDRILDLGCGLGGPTRMLSALKGCRATGVDLTSQFIESATHFARLTGQSESVDFHQASVLALPFTEEVFDGAWHLHLSMNVADKSTMYREIFRVLIPGGRLIIYDPLRGSLSNLVFPVPWAPTPESSFLQTREEMLACLVATGFEIVEVNDGTEEALAWFAQMSAARRKSTKTKHKSMSSRTLLPLEIMARNHRTNLQSGAVTIATIFARKPS